jgi:hypothetical protein
MVNFKGKEPMPEEGSRLPSNPWSLPMVSNGEGAGPSILQLNTPPTLDYTTCTHPISCL